MTDDELLCRLVDVGLIEKGENPLIDANHTMMVVEKMREKGFESRLDICQELIRAYFYKESMYVKHTEPVGYCVHVTIGHATCLAALQAVGGE